jgi:hypothetical protein
VSFELIVDDEIPADNRAWLVRQRGWPTVELRGNAPREVVWMIKSYGNLRPAGDEAIRVVVTDTEQTAPRDGPVVIVAAPVAEQQTGEMEVVPHPITADVDWKRIGAQVRSADAPHGWNALVTKGGVPLVAVTETPVRQVWVGFDAPLWGVSTDFVVFWSNVLDWAGGAGEEAYDSEQVQVVGDEWERADDLSGSPPPEIDPAPGVYRRSDGRLRALNCVDLSVPSSPRGVISRGLSRGSPSTVNMRSLAGVSCVAALGCALAAALHWPVQARKIVPT